MLFILSLHYSMSLYLKSQKWHQQRRPIKAVAKTFHLEQMKKELSAPFDKGKRLNREPRER